MASIPARYLRPGMRIRTTGNKYAVHNRTLHQIVSVESIGAKVRVESIGWFGYRSTTDFGADDMVSSPDAADQGGLDPTRD
jgi:hypothetical protein